jgi:uncharacterized BrkB/YihY/UPF0761 family membrane protein
MQMVHPAGDTQTPARARGGVVARARALGVSAGRRAERLPGAGPVAESLAAEQRHGAPLLAGGLAYRLFFWLVALGLVLAAGASFWVRSSSGDVEATARSFGLAGVAANSATSAVEDGEHARWYFLISGVLLLVYFGIGAARALHATAVIAWRLEPARLRRPLRKSAAFNAMMFAILTASLGAQWLRHHAPGVGILAIALASLVPFAFALVAFARLPHRPISSWRVLWPGAAEFAVGFAGAHVFVSYYLTAKLERSPDLYGALGAATVVLVWLFLFARLLVAGIFLNATVERRGREA